ncbi:hypothetical protein [Actinomadura roseirufa]|uniref:hypothetical protein n=1 Tax=Actinomadura roseirufa TaxID=2094049 RepID=UPI0010410C56|nr:hypothetical protein [Actinomadura roseirufa]
MIILSGVLVVVAIALLVAGIVAGNGDSAQVLGLDALKVIYVSIAVSIVSALCLAIGVFLRRKELFGPGAAPSEPKRRKGARRAKSAAPVPPVPAGAFAQAPAPPPVPHEPGAPADRADDEVEIPAPPADVPEDALVFVVRGRKRYHLDTCRQLAGRDSEELTYAEAKEEGFSPCTACMPDTALAARAAVSVPASPTASTVPTAPTAERSAPPAAEPPPVVLGKPASYSTPAPPPLSLDKTGLDKTGELPHETGATPPPPLSAWPPAPPAVPAPAESADPTVVDLPVRAPAAPPEDALSAPEAPPAREREHETHPEPERSAETGSAAEEAVPELAPAKPTDAFGFTTPFTPPAPVPAGEPAPPAPAAPALSEPEDAAEGVHEPQDSAAPSTEPAPADARDEPFTPPAPAERAAEPDPEPAEAATATRPAPAEAPEPAEAPVPEDDAEPVPADDEEREPRSAPEPEPVPGTGPRVRILSGTKRYHRTDCALIEDIGDEADDLESLSRDEAKARGCTPCLVCRPDDEPDGD